MMELIFAITAAILLSDIIRNLLKKSLVTIKRRLSFYDRRLIWWYNNTECGGRGKILFDSRWVFGKTKEEKEREEFNRKRAEERAREWAKIHNESYDGILR